MELNLVEKVIALEGFELLIGLGPDQMAKVAAIATEEASSVRITDTADVNSSCDETVLQ
jgi:hypothetical protein